jgi:hypothetical protein
VTEATMFGLFYYGAFAGGGAIVGVAVAGVIQFFGSY